MFYPTSCSIAWHHQLFLFASYDCCLQLCCSIFFCMQQLISQAYCCIVKQLFIILTPIFFCCRSRIRLGSHTILQSLSALFCCQVAIHHFNSHLIGKVAMRCEGLLFRTSTIFLVILYSTNRHERIGQCSCYDYCTSPVIWTSDLGSKVHNVICASPFVWTSDLACL